MKLAAAWAAISAFLYGLFAFAAWDMCPANWPPLGRSAFGLIFGMLSVVCFLCAFPEDDLP